MRNITHILAEKFPEEMERATDELVEVVAGVQETGKKGSITLKLDIAQNGENSIVMVASVKSTVPDPAFPRRLAFVTANGDIVADNPNQPDMFPRSVKSERENEEPRQIEAPAPQGEPRNA
jgi:hypothetical protein